MSTGQSFVMLCGWGVKAGWLIPFVDKRVGGRSLCDPSLTRAINERFIDQIRLEFCTRYKMLYKCLYFKLHTYMCFEIGSRNATLRRWVAVAFSVVDTCESLFVAAAATTPRGGDDVEDEVSEASPCCTSVTISKSSSRADSAKRVKSNLRWTTVVRPAQPLQQQPDRQHKRPAIIDNCYSRTYHWHAGTFQTSTEPLFITNYRINLDFSCFATALSSYYGGRVYQKA